MPTSAGSLALANSQPARDGFVVQKLRDAGFNDENILDIVACTAYRNFVNRIHDGLGMSVDILRGNLGDEFVDSFVRD